jgi:ribosomal protein S27AE
MAGAANQGRNGDQRGDGDTTVANIKVTCPHCGRQTWVREHYNDPCQHCGKTVPDPYVK